MKNFFKSSFIFVSGILAVMLLSCSCCNKEHNHRPCPQPKPLDCKFIIGQAEKDGTITLLFDKEAFDCVFRRCVKVNLDGVYEYEDIKIYDEKPHEKKNQASLQITLFNLESGETLNIFVALDKEITGKYVKYYASRRPRENRTVSCKGTDCIEGGCVPNADYTDCTPCGNDKGKCEKNNAVDHAGEITVKDIVGWVIMILVAIIAIL